MFKDGETHYEFWEGVRISGRTFATRPLFNLCREYGTAQVQAACIHLGCFPYTEDLAAITWDGNLNHNLRY